MRIFGIKTISVVAGLCCVTSNVNAQELYRPITAYDAGQAPAISLPSTTGSPVSDSTFKPHQSNTTSNDSFYGLGNQVTAPSQPLSKATLKNPSTSGTGATTAVSNVNVPVKSESGPERLKYVKGMVIAGRATAVDGHSLIINGNSIRLHGIDTPALNQTCNTSAMTLWECGQKAFKHLKTLVGTDPVSCIVTEQVAHGAAAYCSNRQSADFSQNIVSAGFAVPNGKGFKQYSSYAYTAKTDKIGIWTGNFINPKDWRLKNR